MTQTNLRNVAIATSAFACALLLSFGWSAQRGTSLRIESAQAQIDRGLIPQSVAGVTRRHYWRAAYGYGAGAGLAAGPWDFYGGSPCNYERTAGGYYRGAGCDRYWLCGSGACRRPSAERRSCTPHTCEGRSTSSPKAVFWSSAMARPSTVPM